MTAKQPDRRLGLPLICVLTGCVLLALAAVALHFSPGIIPVGDQRSAQQQQPGASLRLVNAGSENEALPAVSAASRQRLVAAYGNLPLAFEANQGQTDPQVKYLARGNGYTLFLTSSVAAISLASPAPSETNQAMQRRMAGFAKSQRLMRSSVASPSVAVLRMQMVGANPHPRVAGNDVLPGVSNYFIGNDPRKWRTNVSNYARVGYQDVYPGVSLAFHGEQRQLEFDFVVAPGADPSPIDLRFTGAKRVATDASGDLVLSSAAGDLQLHKPVAYQEKDGARQLVDACFVVKDGKQVSFVLGNYDRSRELVIDPSLSYSTYLGGTGDDKGTGIAVDGSGNAYVTGEAGDASFPTSTGPAFGGGTHDAFVTKFNSSGTQLYSTFIGGNADDVGQGIAVDGSGNAYVVGNTTSTNFPATNPTIGPGGSQDSFVAKFDSTGAVLYATLLGGSGIESGNAIAVDSSGNAYVTGETDSTDFPMVPNPNPIQPGGSGGLDDGFVAKLNPGGTAFVYSTFLGGSQNDTPTGIALDSINNVYVTGVTLSPNFPTTPGAADTTCGTDGLCNAGSDDAFVTEINAAGTAPLVYSTFLGGSGTDDAEAIAVDSTGAAYVTGRTASSDFPHPLTPFQASLSGPQDAFVTKIAPGGGSVAFSTYFGGTGSDQGFGIALDSSKNVYITGETDSSTGFPLSNQISGALSGTSDAFVAELNPSGSSLLFSTYFGGTGTEDALTGSIAVDSSGNIYVTGDTTSSVGFPLPNASQTTFGGSSDAFVAKIAPAAASPTFIITVSPGSATVTHGSSTSPFTITVTGQNGFSSAVTLSCSGLPAGAACSFNPPSPTPGTPTTLTISTTAASAMLAPSSSRRPGLFYAMWLPVSGLALLGAGFASRKRRILSFLLGCVVFSGLVFLAACGSGSGGGGGGGGGTPPGTYNITVKGTGGGITVSGAPVIQLTVN